MLTCMVVQDFYRGIHYFLISAQKHRYIGGYLLELLQIIRTASVAVLTNTHNLCFEQKYEKYHFFLSKHFQFLEVKFSI